MTYISIKEAQIGLAPHGVLRFSINYGNPVLASRCLVTGKPKGVSVDLAEELAKLVKRDVEFVTFESARESVIALETGLADVGFFAIDPERKKHLSFSAPYLIIEGAYAVRSASPITAIDEVDAAHNLVTVGGGSAYDLYLTRELRHARIERAATSPDVIRQFLLNGSHVAAGVRQQLESAVATDHGLRMLPGSFMSIQQAIAVPANRNSAAIALLRSFVEFAKANGVVGDALRRHCIEGAQVAPLVAQEA